jgi:HEAT repeat protein
MIALLSDSEVLVRAAAAEALGETGDQRTIPYLIECLQDPSHQVRMEAAWGLDRLGWQPDRESDKIRYYLAKEQWNDLAAMGKPAIRPLIYALKEKHSGVRIGATEALIKIGQPAFEALAAARSSDDPEVAAAVHQTLVLIEKKRNDDQARKPAQKDSGIYEKELADSQQARKRASEYLKHTPASSGRSVQRAESRAAFPKSQKHDEQRGDESS